MQLNKYLAHAGVCSRRKAVELIQSGKVTVNNKVITEPGYRVQPDDQVEVNGKNIKQEKKLYILLNKPKDCITTVSDERGRHTVIDLLKPTIKLRVYPVGRLDRNTTGLLVLTNDGELAQRLAHPRYGIKKTYYVVLNTPLKMSDMQKIKEGVMLSDGRVTVDAVGYVLGKRKNNVRVTLHSGKYRIVRRLFESFGYGIIKLDRTAFSRLSKRGLPLRRWRFLTGEEVEQLKQQCGLIKNDIS